MNRRIALTADTRADVAGGGDDDPSTA